MLLVFVFFFNLPLVLGCSFPLQMSSFCCTALFNKCVGVPLQSNSAHVVEEQKRTIKKYSVSSLSTS